MIYDADFLPHDLLVLTEQVDLSIADLTDYLSFANSHNLRNLVINMVKTLTYT